MTTSAVPAHEDPVPEEGISIIGDLEFTKGNGVLNGSGTFPDPYIISLGDVSISSGPALSIQGTTHHFIIRDTRVTGTGENSTTTGILLDNVAYPRIENVTLVNLTRGISTFMSGAVQVKGAEVRGCEIGIELVQSPVADVTDSKVVGCRTGITAMDSDRVHLTRVASRGCDLVGLQIHQTDGFELDFVTTTGCEVGVELMDGNNGRIDSCSAKGNSYADMVLYQADGLVMKRNELGPRGLLLSFTKHASIDTSNKVNGAPLRYLRKEAGNTIDGSAGQVILEDCDQVTVKNLDIEGVAYPISLTDCRGCRIANVSVRNAFTPLYVKGGCSLEVAGCSFTSMGHEFVDPASVMLVNHTGMTMSDTRVGGIDGVGISVIGGNDLLLDNITATGLSCTALCIGGCSRAADDPKGPSVRVEGSRFGYNGWAGIVARTGTLVVNGTSFTGNEGPGIVCSGLESVTITMSTLWDNGWGVVIEDCGQALIRNVQVDGASTGVEVCRSPLIADGVRLSNLTSGMVIEGCQEGTIRDCHLWDIGTTGILVHSSSNIEVAGCRVEGSFTGVLLAETSGCLVETTSISGAINGLVLEGTWNCTVNTCTITGCEGWGIVTQNGGNYTFYHNNLVDNHLEGASSSQARDASGTGGWDNGAEGNFWSDYQDRNPQAIRSGRTWDLPYSLGGGSGAEDLHPLGLVVDLVPPVAMAGHDIVVEQGEDLFLDGTASTDNIGIFEFVWEAQAVGGAVILGGPEPRFCTDCPGIFEVVLTVRDEWGNEGIDLVIVEVLDTEAPLVDLPATIVVDVGEPFLLGGCRMCDHSGIKECQWTIEGDGIDIRLEGISPEARIDRVGSYLLELTVTDCAGNTGTYIATVVVVDRRPPVADAGGDIVVDQGAQVPLDASASWDNVGITAYRWTLGGDRCDDTLVGVRPKLSLDGPGTYQVWLIAEDAAGNVGVDTIVITVRDSVPPVAFAGPDQWVALGTTVTLKATGSWDNVGIIWCTWSIDLGDATITLWGPEVQWIFNTPGTYPVTLTVADGAGNEASDALTVSVAHAEEEDTPAIRPVLQRTSIILVADAGEDVVIHVGDLLTLDAGGDGTGDLTYRWLYRHEGSLRRSDGPSHQVSFERPGTYTIWLSVTNAEGDTAVDELVVTVLPEEPPTPASEESTPWLVSHGWLVIEVLLVLALIGLFWSFSRPQDR